MTELGSAGTFVSQGREYSIPKMVFHGVHGPSAASIRVAIFAGIHGDEPAGVFALADFLSAMKREPDLFRAYHVNLYPLCNPTGCEDGTRHSRFGKDLNREFWQGSTEPEVQILERELEAGRFDGIIALHSDDTSHGLYGFIRGHALAEQLLKPALASAKKALPVNEADIIDGFHSVEGVIREGYKGILSAPASQSPAPFEIVLETPSEACVDLQRKAFVLALTEILRQYRRNAAYAADL